MPKTPKAESAQAWENTHRDVNILPRFLWGNIMAKKRIVYDRGNETKFNTNKDKEQRTYNDIVFDSVMEMKYYRDVILPRVRSGKIKRYELQKPYILQPKFHYGSKPVQPIVYVADFYIEYNDGSTEVVETKGCADSVAKIKRKMFWYTYPEISYKWICYSKIDGTEENGGWCDYEYVQEQRRKRKKEKALKELEGKGE